MVFTAGRVDAESSSRTIRACSRSRRVASPSTRANVVIPRSIRSRRMNRCVTGREKYPCKRCPWKVCTRTGTRASTAAIRPSTPAFAMWVCTMSGRSLRSSCTSAMSDRISSSKPIERRNPLSVITSAGTFRPSRKSPSASIAGPRITICSKRVVSSPLSRSTSITDAPPMLVRVKTCTTRTSCEFTSACCATSAACAPARRAA